MGRVWRDNLGNSITRRRQPFAQRQRSDVLPHFIDICQALLLVPAPSDGTPAERWFMVGGPDGVLLLVIDHDVVRGRVFSVILVHSSASLQSAIFVWRLTG